MILKDMSPLPLQYLVVILTILLATFVVLWFITNRKQITLQKQVKNYHHADRLNKEVFAIITHDLKEPLLNFQLLVNQLRNPEKPINDQFLTELDTQIKLTQTNLRTLTEWAICEMSCCTSKTNPSIIVNQIVEEEIKEVCTLARAKNIQIENSVDSKMQWELNRCILQITLRNLLTNAIKFSPEGTTIMVCMGNDGLEVRDQGIGLSPTIQHSLFKSRVRPGYGTRRENGFGIGLYITGTLLNKNGFTITADNLEGAGARFSVQKATA